MSELEDVLAFQLFALGIPFERQCHIIPGRRYTWDFCLPERIAVEVQGIVWKSGSEKDGKPVRGAHQTGVGLTRDARKHHLLVMAGWVDLYVTREMIETMEAVHMIEEARKMRCLGGDGCSLGSEASSPSG